MSWRTWFVVAGLAVAGTAGAAPGAPGDVILVPGQDELIQAAPGDIVSLSYRVRTRQAGREVFDSRVFLPRGWQIVTPEHPFALDSGAAALRLVHIRVPARVPAGEFVIMYAVWPRREPSARVEQVVRVVVPAVDGLEVDVLDAPGFVVAGRSYEAVFVVRNTGNSAVRCTAEVEVRPNRPAVVRPQVIDLAAGGAAEVVVRADTDGALEASETLRLTFRARADNGAVGAAVVAVDVLPRASGSRRDGYWTLPAELSVNLLTADRGGSGPDLQLELAGEGLLGADRGRGVSFHLLGPGNTHDSSSLGRRAEYRAAYWSEGARVMVGDQVYALTPLTELGRYGRGIGGEIERGRWRLGGYRMEERDRPLEETAGFVELRTSEHTAFAVNYLAIESGDDRDVASLRAVLGGRGVQAEVEYARNARGGDGAADAYQLRLSGESGPVLFRAETTRADEGFSGYYANQESHWAMLEARLPGSSRLWGSFHLQRTNLSLAPGRTAPEDGAGVVGYSRRLGSGTVVSVRAATRRYRDRQQLPTFHNRRQTLALELSRRIGSVNLLATVERGELEDRVRQRTGDAELLRVTGSWQPRSGWALFANVAHSRNLFELGTRDTSVGAGGSFELGRRLELGLDLQWHRTESTRLGQSYLRVAYRTARGRTVSVGARHASHETGPAVWLQYTVPVGIPVQRRTDVGSVSGRVLDPETGLGLADVIVVVADSVAVTDSRGFFELHAVAAGASELAVNLGARSVNLVTAEPTPMPLEVHPGRRTRRDIAVTRAAALGGRVVAVEAAVEGDPLESSGGETEGAVGAAGAGAVRGLAGITVVLRRGNETLRRLTDDHGRFRFSGLRPGRWTLSADEVALPVDLRLERAEVPVELEAGAVREIEVRAAAVKRLIRIQNPTERLVVRNARSL